LGEFFVFAPADIGGIIRQIQIIRTPGGGLVGKPWFIDREKPALCPIFFRLFPPQALAVNQSKYDTNGS
jgi:hypothetical protein